MTTRLTWKKWHQLTGHRSGIYGLAAGEAPDVFYSAAGDGWLVRWTLDDPEQGRLVARAEVQVYSLAYLAETHSLLAGDMNGGVHWINLREDRPNRHVEHHQKGTFGFRQCGDYIFSVGGGGLLTRWDPLRQRSEQSLQLSQQALRSIAYSAERDEIAVGSSDNSIYLLEASTLRLRHTISRAHDNSVFSLAYHPNGQWLLSGGRDAHLKVWDLAAPDQPLISHPAHWFTLNDLVFATGTPWLLTASRDKTLKVWDAHTLELVKVLDTARDGGHINSVNRLLWLPEAQVCVSASDDRSLILWKAE
jgi:WD40 repeat protein